MNPVEQSLVLIDSSAIFAHPILCWAWYRSSLSWAGLKSVVAAWAWFLLKRSENGIVRCVKPQRISECKVPSSTGFQTSASVLQRWKVIISSTEHSCLNIFARHVRDPCFSPGSSTGPCGDVLCVVSASLAVWLECPIAALMQLSQCGTKICLVNFQDSRWTPPSNVWCLWLFPFSCVEQNSEHHQRQAKNWL